MDQIAKVYNNIYIGSLVSANNDLTDDITQIINLSGVKYTVNICKLDIELDDVILDNDNINNHIASTALAIACIEKSVKQNRNVLIHCAAGINRSAYVIGMYLAEKGFSFDEIFDMLKSANDKRKLDVLTNKSFKLSLQQHCAVKRIFALRMRALEKLQVNKHII